MGRFLGKRRRNAEKRAVQGTPASKAAQLCVRTETYMTVPEMEAMFADIILVKVSCQCCVQGFVSPTLIVQNPHAPKPKFAVNSQRTYMLLILSCMICLHIPNVLCVRCFIERCQSALSEAVLSPF